MSWNSSCLLTAGCGSLPDGGFIGCDILSPGETLDGGSATGNLCHMVCSLKQPQPGFLYLFLPKNVGLNCLTHYLQRLIDFLMFYIVSLPSGCSPVAAWRGVAMDKPCDNCLPSHYYFLTVSLPLFPFHFYANVIFDYAFDF